MIAFRSLKWEGGVGVRWTYEYKDPLNRENHGVGDEGPMWGQSRFSGESGWEEVVSSLHTASHLTLDKSPIPKDSSSSCHMTHLGWLYPTSQMPFVKVFHFHLCLTVQQSCQAGAISWVYLDAALST